MQNPKESFLCMKEEMSIYLSCVHSITISNHNPLLNCSHFGLCYGESQFKRLKLTNFNLQEYHVYN